MFRMFRRAPWIGIALLLAALASRAGDRVDFLAGDRWVRARVAAAANRTTLLADLVQAMAPLDAALVEASWPALASAVSDITRRRSLVVLLTPLEPAAILETYKGMLRIDRGSRHGVRPATCVVGPQGVVGVVTETADFTSTVATLHHVDCRIGAMVLRNRVRAYDGVVQANGSDFNRICTMEYIDMKEDIRPGDVVVTSPESLFPPGLLIGRIGAVHDAGALWKSAEVMPAVDPYAVDEVFLIRRAVDDPEYVGGPEGDFLDLPPPPDAASSQAPETPDTRPLQERYAP